MRLTKTLGYAGALIAAALVGGTLINTTLATDHETETTDTDSTHAAYCAVFREAFAAELGVTTGEVTAAGQAAANAAIDAAVAAGDLHEDRAARLRERVEAHDGEGCGWFGKARAFGRGFGLGLERGIARGFLGGTVFEAAADALGTTSDELIGDLREAGSIEAVAEAEGADYEAVQAAILADIQADLDAAVAEGMSQERADAIIERLSSWLEEGGELGKLGPGRGHHHGPGFRMGPGSDDATDADA